MSREKYKFGVYLIVWYASTLISAIYTKLYLDQTKESFTFTLITFGYGAILSFTLSN